MQSLDWHEIDDDAPEWTDEVAARAVPFDQAPEDVQRLFRKPRGPGKKPAKVPVTIRLDQDVVAHFKATGDGWQTRMNDALKKAVELAKVAR